MQDLINQLSKNFPHLNYKAGSHFYWSPETSEIVYSLEPSNEFMICSLLHETGHALLDHQNYQADYELLKLEIAAWDKARLLARDFDIDFDEEHVQDCLDTYRDWIYKRSICPTCSSKCLQQGDFVHYRCFNCHTIWKVSSSRFCRSYRKKKLSLPA